MQWQEEFKRWIKNGNRNAKAELLALQDNAEEIYQRFSCDLQFGTAGMRGFLGYGTNRMNCYTVARATQGVAEYLKKMIAEKSKITAVIAYDTRGYSYTFAKIAAQVFAKNAISCYLYQTPQPVPILSYTVQKLQASVGIMITASHNPKEYNGYKVYHTTGGQMPTEATAAIASEIEKIDYFTAMQKGNTYENAIYPVPKEIVQAYYAQLENLLFVKEAGQREGSKQKIHFIYTPLHGTGRDSLVHLMTKLKMPFAVVAKQMPYDANFSTVSIPNPENAESLQQAIALAKEKGAEVVLATDPDADRLGVAIQKDDGTFLQLTGNQVGILLLEYLLSQYRAANLLPQDAVVLKSFVSTNLAAKICQAYGVQLIDVPVGFKYISEQIDMLRADNKKFLFAFEESCGYLYGENGSKDKDGVVAALLFASLATYLQKRGKTVYQQLEEIYQKYGYSLEYTQNIAFHGVSSMQEMEAILAKMRQKKIQSFGGIAVTAICDYEKGICTLCQEDRSVAIAMPKNNTLYFALEGGSFVAVRPSGTEPKLKIYYAILAKNPEKAKNLLQNIQQNFTEFMKK